MSTSPQPATPARAAAEWWADRIAAPTFRAVRDSERDFGSDFAELGAHTIAHQNPLTPYAATAFADILERRIAEALAKETARLANSANPETRAMEPSVGLHTDYDPDEALRDAATEAGVSTSRFPWKTRMWVHPEYVTANLGFGYGSTQTLVWSAPGWVRPTCGQNRYEDREPVDETCGLPRFHEKECGDFAPDGRRCGECGEGYSAHYSSAAYSRGNRCRGWGRTVTR